MSEVPPQNSVAWRVAVLEREVERIKEGKPDVVAERVQRLSEELKAAREELGSQRKILISFFASFALVAILVVIAYVATGNPAG